MDYVKIIEEATRKIIAAVDTKVSSAAFDKTSIGCVIKKTTDGYLVQAFGGQYDIACSNTLAIGQHVAVLAPQSNFKKLVILNVLSDI